MPAQRRLDACAISAAQPARFAVDAVVNCARASARRRSPRNTEAIRTERVPRLVLAQGQLLQLYGPAGVLAADLSGAASTAGSACTSRSISPAACGSGPTWSGSTREDYDVDAGARGSRSTPHPHATGRRCRTASLVPDYAGIRPKLTGPGRAGRRFHDRRRPREHGVPGLVHLFGIEIAGADRRRCRWPTRW